VFDSLSVLEVSEDEVARRLERARQIDAYVKRLTRIREAELQWVHANAELLSDEARRRLFGPSGKAPAPEGEAARLDAQSPSVAQEARLAGERPSAWRDAIREVLERADTGLPIRKIAEELSKGPMAARLKQNPNGIYTACARMVAHDQLVKHGELLFLPQVFVRLSEAGQIPFDDPHDSLSGTAKLIVEIIEDVGRPCPPGEIISCLREDEDIARRMMRNPGYAYQLLSKMVARGHLVRSDGTYRLPHMESEPNSPDGGSHEQPPDEL
jgi:hypothetical protein